MLGFVKASKQAKELLATSDAEWDRLRPLMRIDDDAVFKNTVKRFREGIPNRPIAEEEADTAKVYDAARQARRRGTRRQGDDHVARNVLAGAEGRLVSLAAKQQPRHQSEVTAPYSVRIDAKTFQRATGGDVAVIRDLAFELAPETFTCLIGPSGCGKTTTLRIILGLDGDFRGAVSDELRQARHGGRIPGAAAAAMADGGAEHPARAASAPRRKDLTPILDAVELTGFRNSFPSELSLGMARRAALARAFSVEPEVLLLDEPFVSLDEATANRLRQLLIELWQSSPVTVLMVTHNVREAVRLADRLIILSPRPAHVVGVVDLPLPRRRAPWHEARCPPPGTRGTVSELLRLE